MNRYPLTADRRRARQWRELSRACADLVGRIDEIEEDARERIKRDAHREGTTLAGVALMLFEALRLTEHNDGAGPRVRAPGASVTA